MGHVLKTISNEIRTNQKKDGDASLFLIPTSYFPIESTGIERAQMLSTVWDLIPDRSVSTKHLIVLREQLAPFEVDFAITETELDFSHVYKSGVIWIVFASAAR